MLKYILFLCLFSLNLVGCNKEIYNTESTAAVRYYNPDDGHDMIGIIMHKEKQYFWTNHEVDFDFNSVSSEQIFKIESLSDFKSGPIRNQEANFDCLGEYYYEVDDFLVMYLNGKYLKFELLGDDGRD